MSKAKLHIEEETPVHPAYTAHPSRKSETIYSSPVPTLVRFGVPRISSWCLSWQSENPQSHRLQAFMDGIRLSRMASTQPESVVSRQATFSGQNPFTTSDAGQIQEICLRE